MVDCIAPPQARITVAPDGRDVSLIVSEPRPVACQLSREAARALARDLLDVAGGSCDLVTIRPGPVLHLWRNGIEAGSMTLSTGAALTLLADLANAIRGAS